MKLIGLLIAIVGWILNLIYGIIMLPYTVIIHFRNRKWRNPPQVGDICFFKNALGCVTRCNIHKVDGDRVYIKTAMSSQWSTLEGLRKY